MPARLPIFMIAILLLAHPLRAQKDDAATAPVLPPLATMLDRDGSLHLDTSFNGSLDPTGWRMTIGADGRPRFVADTADAHWDDRFLPSPGVDGEVLAIAAHGEKMYVAGHFAFASETPANSVVEWEEETRAWRSLGGGVTGFGFPGTVRALAFVGDDLYVGGDFDAAGGIETSGIARWDGAAWHEVGEGVTGSVRALAAQGNGLYVGGSFQTNGAPAIRDFARWNLATSAWEPVGRGVHAGVYVTVNAIAAAPDGSTLYVGGAFDSAGSVAAANVARWDGSAWSALGKGVDKEVAHLLLARGDLYVAGGFLLAGDIDAPHVARWRDEAWWPLPEALAGHADAFVAGIDTAGGTLFIGSVRASDSSVSKYLSDIVQYRFEDDSWTPLATSLDLPLRAIAISRTQRLMPLLYIGGSFASIGTTPAANIAAYHLGATWTPLGLSLGNAPDGDVRAVAVRGRDLYIGGTFRSVGGVMAPGVARWRSDSNRWDALGAPLSGDPRVNAIAIDGENVFVGGSFVIVGSNVPGGNLARFDGTRWWPIRGIEGEVFALAVGAGNLFIGGNFTRLFFEPVGRILRWHIYLEEFRPLGSGTDGTVRALAMAPNGRDLYAGGSFTMAGGVAANGIARWDLRDTVWRPLGQGVALGSAAGEVRSLAFAGGDLYVGGRFDRAGSITTRGIAAWDGSGWGDLGGGVNEGDGVNAIAVAADGGLFVGGAFGRIGGVEASNVARWDTALRVWTPVGSGADAPVAAVATGGGDLFIGGSFLHAGGKVSFRVGRWSGVPDPPLAAPPADADRPVIFRLW